MAQPSKKPREVAHLRPVPDSGRAAAGEGPRPSLKHKPEDFIVPAHDENGESIVFTFRASSRYMAILQDLVWSRRIPQYRSPSDALRNFMDRGLKWIESIEPGSVGDDQRKIDLINRNIQRADSAASFAEAIEALEKAVAKLSSLKLRGMAVQLVYEQLKVAKQLEHRLLRDLWVREIRARFGYLLSGASGSLAAEVVDEIEEEENEQRIHASWGYDAEDREIVPEHSSGTSDDDEDQD